MSFSDLPVELQQKIFSYLNWPTRVKIENVCKDWQTVLRNRLWYMASEMQINIHVNSDSADRKMNNNLLTYNLKYNHIIENENISAVRRHGNPTMHYSLFPIGLQSEVDVSIIKQNGRLYLSSLFDNFLRLTINRYD